MTRKKIMALQAGSKLDVLVAEDVMGWELIELDYESLTEQPGLVLCDDLVWRTPSAKAWQAEIERDGIECVGDYWGDPVTRTIRPCEDAPDAGNGKVVGSFSVDVAAAFEVVEKLIAGGQHVIANTAQNSNFKDHPHHVEIQTCARSDRRFYVAFFRDPGFDSPGDGHGWGPTLPLAICRAALATTVKA